jgi:hypothetical protein
MYQQKYMGGFAHIESVANVTPSSEESLLFSRLRYFLLLLDLIAHNRVNSKKQKRTWTIHGTWRLAELIWRWYFNARVEFNSLAI